MKFDRMWMGMADTTEVTRSTMAIIDAIQDRPARTQVPAICAAFVLALECAGMNVGDALTISKNIINDADGRRPEFKAIEDYINNEL